MLPDSAQLLLDGELKEDISVEGEALTRQWISFNQYYELIRWLE